MVIIMDMDTGRYITGEFGAFEEEVLNAQWLPQPLTPQLGLQQESSSRGSSAAMAVDTDAFLRTVYLSQE
ncbi:MAG: hypothetical protein PHQ05_12005 [Sterolibacterium sp.]|nr:hypothetical protein [Sterolibacterium sp.]